MIMAWLFEGILFICARVVSFAARARHCKGANKQYSVKKSCYSLIGTSNLNMKLYKTSGISAIESTLFSRSVHLIHILTYTSTTFGWALLFIHPSAKMWQILTALSFGLIMLRRETSLPAHDNATFSLEIFLPQNATDIFCWRVASSSN